MLDMIKYDFKPFQKYNYNNACLKKIKHNSLFIYFFLLVNILYLS